MNNILKKLTNKYKHCFSLLVLFLWSTSFNFLHAQTIALEVIMIDTMDYTDFGLHDVASTIYPPSNLFDSKANTCFVIKTNQKKSQRIFIRVPDIYRDSVYLKIFSGYGKSEILFRKNSRPKVINISFYFAFIPDGYVTENSYKCKAIQLPMQQTFNLSDTYAIQQANLIYSMNDFKVFRSNYLENHFSEQSNLIDTFMLVQLEISDIWEGTEFPEDICISEIFFNDCYASHVNNTDKGGVEDIYLNNEENALYISKNQSSSEIYSDTESILQIIQATNNNEWAVVNILPREIDGRVESTYLIFDLLRREVINEELLKILPDYYPGEPLLLEEHHDKIYLLQESGMSGIKKIELRHYYY